VARARLDGQRTESNPHETDLNPHGLNLVGIVRSLAWASEARAVARELLVARHSGLVSSYVQRYRNAPEPAEDLMQAGYVGLMKAISRFDPLVGGNLAAYAQACIRGEIKRHFRDKCWPVHVERSVQNMVLEARDAARQLTQDLGRVPAEWEMARHLRVSGEQLRDARRAEIAFRPSAVAAHWGELPSREQKILRMRFGDGMTQAQIGQQLGISQMHVSRLSAHALGYLRQCLFGPRERPAGAGPAAARPVNARASPWREEPVTPDRHRASTARTARPAQPGSCGMT